MPTARQRVALAHATPAGSFPPAALVAPSLAMAVSAPQARAPALERVTTVWAAWSTPRARQAPVEAHVRVKSPPAPEGSETTTLSGDQDHVDDARVATEVTGEDALSDPTATQVVGLKQLTAFKSPP